MTFTDIDDLETLELAFVLWSVGDAPDLDAAAALASDLSAPLFDYLQEWELDSYEWQMALAFAQSA